MENNDLRELLRGTIYILLNLAALTLIYIAFLMADNLILLTISYSFKELAQESKYAADLLFGIKFFSACGIAIQYVIHTIGQLLQDYKRLIQEPNSKQLPPQSDEPNSKQLPSQSNKSNSEQEKKNEP